MRVLALSLVVSFLGGCGLIDGESSPPDPAVVARARQTEAGTWERLSAFEARFREDGPEALAEIRAQAQLRPGDLRLAALLQDLQLRVEGEAAVRSRSLQAWKDAPSAKTAYLAARVVDDRERAVALVNEALALDPELSPARVLKLALEARVGRPEVLEDLIDLLHEDPGCAEGWRLLGALAPLYARPDLARAAAETEPWGPAGDRGWVVKLQADAMLADGDPASALRRLQELPLEDREGRILRAAAWTDAGHPERAWEILLALVEEDPEDAQVHFNLAVLARDYLGYPGRARRHLNEVLDLAERGASLPLRRQLQAELWLAELEAAAEERS